MKAKIVTLGIVAAMMLAGLGTLNVEARGPPEGIPPFDTPRVRPMYNLVEVAIAANQSGPFEGDFEILITALQATGLDEVLANESYQFTVFAPTDAAFEALAAELDLTLDELVALLLDPDNEAFLVNVLLYHVTDGRLYSIPIVHKKQIEMLNGQMLYVDGTELTDQQDRTINIEATDIEATNGVIHVIDNVLIPA